MEKLTVSNKRLFIRAKQSGFVLITFLAVILTSCSKKGDLAINNSSNKNIVETLDSYPSTVATDNDGIAAGAKSMKPTFATLKVALARTGLTSTVSTQQLTVFAPTDAAFASLGLYPNNIASVPNLREILLYHVVAGLVYSNQLSNGFVSTVNGAAVQIDLSNGVKVNDANVIAADISARNGVIHVIDKVLLPPTLNLVELAQSLNPEFTILVSAVIKAGLTDVLANGGPYTVFAPTNDAFVALLAEKGFTSLDDVPTDVLTDILKYHVVNGRVYSSDLTNGPVNTLNGSFNINVNTLTITDAQGRDAGLVPSLLNVQATNGVVHVINRVILP